VAAEALDVERAPRALHLHARPQALEEVLVRWRAEADPVLLLHFVPRVGEAVGKVAIVGQDQEARGVLVQAPDGVEPGRTQRGRDEVEHGAAAPGVVDGGEDPGGLVEEQVDPGRSRGGEGQAVQRERAAGVAGGRVHGRPTVHGNAPLADRGEGRAPREAAGPRHHPEERRRPHAPDCNHLDERGWRESRLTAESRDASF
jgi:hypothetical protein